MPDNTHNDLKQWVHSMRGAIIWQADGQESSVAISALGGVSFLVNGKSDGNAFADASTQVMFPMIGAMIHPDPKRSLVIGLGTGESAGWLASLPSMEQVDVVELEPVIRHVADVCSPLNHDVLRHPKVRVVFNDGREVLQTSRGAYDLIASEPSNPYRAGVANLYTLEFYESVRARLAPDGLFLQWLQGYEIDTPTIRTVLQTAQRAFGHVEIWETKPDDLVLVCSLTPHEYDLNRLRSRLSEPAYQAAVQFAWRTTSVEGVLSHFLANEKYVAAVADAAAGCDQHRRPQRPGICLCPLARQAGGGPLGDRHARGSPQENFHRPLRIATGVDWEAVEDQRIAFYVGVGGIRCPRGCSAASEPCGPRR